MIARKTVAFGAPLSVALAAWLATGCGKEVAKDKPASAPPPPSSARLIADVESVRPGEPFAVGVLITLENGWHTYGQDPGDSGMAPMLEWELPPGWEIGPLQWPEPKRYETNGIVNFIYEDRVLLMAEVTPPAAAPVMTNAVLACDATWLICREICRVMDAELRIDLPVRDADPVVCKEWRPLFESTRAELPKAK